MFTVALACMVLFGATDGVVPFLVKYLLDGIFKDKNAALLYVLPGVMLLFALFRALCDFGQQYLMSKVGHLIVRDLRNDLNAQLLKLSPGYFIKHHTGDLLSRVTSDVVLVRSVLTESVASIIRDTIRIVALLVAAVYLDPTLALIAFVGFPIGIWPVYRFGRRIRKLTKQGQQSIGSLTALLNETIIGNRVVKIFARESFERQRFAAENQALTTTFVKSERIRAFTGPLNEVLATAAITAVLLYGGVSVINGTRSQGEFIAFLLSLFLLYDPFKRLSRVHGTVQQGMGAAERLFEVLDTAPSVEDPSRPVALGRSHCIEFNAVSFSYSGSDTGVLKDIELRIEEGQRVALVGFSGAGKTTLVDLIPRFIDPTHGEVRIGGVNIRQVSLAELRQRITMVSQHTFLFHDTVLSNIAYGRPGASRTDIESAARAAYAYDFIQQLPAGFETVLGEGGLSLSGGERQRIAIARAILKDAPILILDEATASLDNRAEREVQQALERLAQQRTCLVIAHRLSTVYSSHLIVVMRDGSIVERGTHEQLLRKEGEYSRLHALQFQVDKGGVDGAETLTA